MRYQVPQYIDIEDKLLFNFTVKQFLYIIVPILAYLLMFMAKWPTLEVVLVEAILVPYAYASAFIVMNGQKFNTVLFNFILFRLKSKFYLWNKVSRVKIFPEVDITLFHKKAGKKINESELSKKIKEISKEIET